MNSEEYVKRAISHYAKRTGAQPSESLSRVVQVKVRLENVNGVLAEYSFDAATDKIIRVETDPATDE
jgi:hypothetical protein